MKNEAPKHFKARILLLSTMLTLAGIAFIGIGMFRYTPHPILHNVFARGLPCLMSVLMIALPWPGPAAFKSSICDFRPSYRDRGSCRVPVVGGA